MVPEPVWVALERRWKSEMELAQEAIDRARSEATRYRTLFVITLCALVGGAIGWLVTLA